MAETETYSPATDEGLTAGDQRHLTMCLRIEGALRLLYPDEMTPTAQRVIRSILDDEYAKAGRS